MLDSNTTNLAFKPSKIFSQNKGGKSWSVTIYQKKSLPRIDPEVVHQLACFMIEEEGELTDNQSVVYNYDPNKRQLQRVPKCETDSEMTEHYIQDEEA